MASNKNQGGLPITWVDALAPAFANGPGSAAPSYTTNFIAATGGTGNEISLPTFTASSEDRVYTTTQIQHDIFIPSTGNVVFKPHVHWTFNTEPTNSRTVIWEWNYVVANANVSFASSVSQLIAPTYTTTAAAEIRLHVKTSLGDITLPVASCGPSMILVGNLKLKSTSTVGDAQVGLLGFDIHYQAGPTGTDLEYS